MDRILFSVGPINIYWYSVTMLLSILIGIYLALKESKKHAMESFISDLITYAIIFGIIGARLYYVIFNFDNYKHNLLSIFKIWEGGLAIHGGIIAGIITIFIYSKKQNIPLLSLLDIFAPALVLGQAIGRWGNFFNMEAYGPETTLETLKELFIPNFVIEGMYINGAYHHPTFYYESIGCLLIFLIMILIGNNKKIKKGQISSLYFIFYGILRFTIESLRQDSLMFLNLKIAQLVSIIMIILGIVLLIKSYIKNSKVKL